MKQIRNSVFETNSSSTHSLSVRGKGYEYEQKEPLKGFFGEFGWGYEEQYRPDEKLSYVLTAIGVMEGLGEFSSEAIDFKRVKERFLNNKYFKWLNEAIKEKTGSEIKFDWLEIEQNYKLDHWYCFGYIDHQSWNDGVPDPLYDMWVDNKKKFKKNMIELIFSYKYAIIIDNDNH